MTIATAHLVPWYEWESPAIAHDVIIEVEGRARTWLVELDFFDHRVFATAYGGWAADA